MNQSLCALFWSGGKDSALALHRLVGEGVRVKWLVNLFEGSSGRVRFHGVRAELLRAQSRSLGVELLQRPVGAEGFEAAFLRVLGELRERGCGGAAFGNVHLQDVREWYEVRVRGAGFEHVDPLWGRSPEGVVREFVELGYRAVVTSVYLSSGRTEWLGAEVDSDFLHAVQEAGADPCGEFGEYHTFVFDGPAFAWPVGFRVGEQLERDGHRFLDLLPEVGT
ncbi:MAG: diphthine--ammonia ligase [bacterium]